MGALETSSPPRGTRQGFSSLAVRLRPASWGANWPVWAFILGMGIALKAELAPLYLFNSPDDDQLMVQMAKGFLDGHWSSNWAATGVATLVKPVGYPIFLTSAHFLPWSPMLTAYLLYLIGAVLIAWSWWLIAGSRAQSTVILTALVFHPVNFVTGSQRIYRDSFIDSIATIAIGLSFVIAAQMRKSPALMAHPDLGVHQSGAPSLQRRWSGRLRRIMLYLLALLVGVLVGVVMITKPTWQWLLIAVVAPVAFPVIQKMRRGRWQWPIVLKACIAGVLAVSGAYGVVATTVSMNQRTYHVALVEDLSSGAFARAWKAWASVEAGPPEPHVVITRDMRMAVYRVSPAASRLRPYLESPRDKWKRADCHPSTSATIRDPGSNGTSGTRPLPPAPFSRSKMCRPTSAGWPTRSPLRVRRRDCNVLRFPYSHRGYPHSTRFPGEHCSTTQRPGSGRWSALMCPSDLRKSPLLHRTRSAMPTGPPWSRGCPPVPVQLPPVQRPGGLTPSSG